MLSQQFKMHVCMALKDSTSPSIFILCKSSLLCSSLSLVTLWSHQLCHIAGLFKESHTRQWTFSFAQICNPDFLIYFFFLLNLQVPNFLFSSFSHLQPTDLLVDYTKPFKQTCLYSLNDFVWILPSR